jgi:hypothetical protein
MPYLKGLNKSFNKIFLLNNVFQPPMQLPPTQLIGPMQSVGSRQFLYLTCKGLQDAILYMLESQRVYTVSHFYLCERVTSNNTGITWLTYKASGGGRPVRVCFPENTVCAVQ